MNEHVLPRPIGAAVPTAALGVADRLPAPSAVSWAAIIAGATGAAALSLILLLLGTGLGLSSVSAWTGEGASAPTLGISTILWITITQLAAAAMGGYLAGRLRTRWTDLHTDEVYFRDTAHGFLAWALATLFTVATLTSAIGSIVSGGVQAGAAVAGGAATTAAAAMPAAAGALKQEGSNPSEGYFVDALFRKDAGANGAASEPMDGDAGNRSASEVGRILANALKNGTLAADDTKYVGQMVSQRTGLPLAEAEKRVNDTFARMQAKAKEAETAARDAADKTRKASAYGSLWLCVSLLIGAFCAGLAATYGGRQRDQT